MWNPFHKEKAKVVFSSDYIYGLPTIGDHQNFDLMKYKKIKDKLVEERLLKRYDILRPDLCPYEDLKLVHTESYLKSLQDPLHVSQLLRLSNVDLFYNSILEYYRAVTGGTLLATAYALRWNVPAFNLGGGYHHAHPDRAEGFCLINDVAIAIEKFRYLHRSQRFMIIDLDYHQGNGNLLYFKDDPDVYTFSMHADSWVEIGREHNKDILLPAGIEDKEYMDILCRELNEACGDFQPQIVFYIAGSDPYEKDTLADMNISRDGMLRRNLFVFQKVRKKKIPLVILAGGGYGIHSWEVYYDFIKFCLKKRVNSRNYDEFDCQSTKEVEYTENKNIHQKFIDRYSFDMIQKKYWHIAKRLTTAQLQQSGDKDSQFDELDLYNVNIGKRGHSFFLGYYSLEGLELVFDKYGVRQLFEKKGYNDIKLFIDTDDSFTHRLSVYHQSRNPENMLCEVVVKREQSVINMPFETPLNGKSFNNLAIEWLAMQNPAGEFTTNRPRLPGQKYPGLGLASKAVELLIIAAWRLSLAGLLNTPEHYHNAHLYSRIFYYISPMAQGRLRALERDLKRYPLHVCSWAFEYDAVIDLNEKKPVEWVVGKQIVPLDASLKALFDSREYKRAVRSAAEMYKFELDFDKYKKISKEKEKQ